MKILSYTCSILWLVTEDKKRLSSKAIDAFLDEDNEIYFSVVSAREISIKSSIGKLDLSLPVHDFLKKQIVVNELSVLPIGLSHVTKVADLPFHPKVPFDRLPIAQVITEDMPIISRDPVFTTIMLK